MRDNQRRRLEHEVVIKKDVEIDESRPIAKTRLAPDARLGLLQRAEKFLWPERCRRLRGHVEERWLISVAPRGSFKDSRRLNPLQVRSERGEGRAQVDESVSKICPERDENCMFHVRGEYNMIFEHDKIF